MQTRRLVAAKQEKRGNKDANSSHEHLQGTGLMFTLAVRVEEKMDTLAIRSVSGTKSAGRHRGQVYEGEKRAE
jgi:hypothetical protein